MVRTLRDRWSHSLPSTRQWRVHRSAKVIHDNNRNSRLDSTLVPPRVVGVFHNRNRNSNVRLCHLDQWEQYAEVCHNRIMNDNVRLCHLDSDTQEVGILIVWQMVMDGFEWSSSWYGWTFWCLSIVVDGDGSDDDKNSSIATFFSPKASWWRVMKRAVTSGPFDNLIWRKGRQP